MVSPEVVTAWTRGAFWTRRGDIHNDWTLPNIFEIESLRDFGVPLPSVDPAFNTACVGGRTVLTCSCTIGAGYWSSTTSYYAPTGALYVIFTSGRTGVGQKADGYHVRAVRVAS